jgi:AbiV family abortive infection protein
VDEATADALDKLVVANPIIANGARLVQDADLLYRFERWPSVVMLAVLGLEEIGKFMLIRWSADDARFRRLLTNHRAKQMAIGALFMTEKARQEWRAKEKSLDLNLPDVERLPLLIKAMIGGLEDSKRFAVSAASKVIEVMKWTNLYYDEEFATKGLEPSKTTEQNAREVMGYCSRTLSLVAVPGNIEIAMNVFPMLPMAKKLIGEPLQGRDAGDGTK